MRTNDVIRFTGGVPGAKLNWQLLSFFHNAGSGGTAYCNANQFYDGTNHLITTLGINIDGKLRLPLTASSSSIYEATWINNIRNKIDIDYLEW